MGERSVAWRPSWQEVLQAAQDGHLKWQGHGGLGGTYTLRGQYLFGPLAEIVEGLLKTDVVAFARPGVPRLTCLIEVTAKGRHVLAEWRKRAA